MKQGRALSNLPRLGMSRHVLIAGTGRAGTSFLVHLLTELGLDTGYEQGQITDDSGHYDPVARAGMEHDIFRRPCPHIVKAPNIVARIEELEGRRDICVERAIIPIRDLAAAADSRSKVQAKYPKDWGPIVPGGLFHAATAQEQEAVLARDHHKLLFHLTRMDVPITFLHFPRFAVDEAYTYRKLFEVFDITQSRDEFSAIFQTVSKPERIGREIDASPMIGSKPRRRGLLSSMLG